MKFYANPYNTEATGFYFESNDEFLDKAKASDLEEFEIEVINVTLEELELVAAIGVDQCNIKDIIEYIETSDKKEWPAIFFLLDNSIVHNLDDAKDLIDDVCITESSLIDAATELFDEYYGHSIPDNIKRYIDYETFARDCEICGDMIEFEFGGKTYTCTNANAI